MTPRHPPRALGGLTTPTGRRSLGVGLHGHAPPSCGLQASPDARATATSNTTSTPFPVSGRTLLSAFGANATTTLRRVVSDPTGICFLRGYGRRIVREQPRTARRAGLLAEHGRVLSPGGLAAGQGPGSSSSKTAAARTQRSRAGDRSPDRSNAFSASRLTAPSGDDGVGHPAKAGAGR